MKFEISKLKTKLSEILSKEPQVRSEPIKVVISSYRAPDLTILDLPGYDHTNKITKEIIFNYAKEESNLLVLVETAKSEKFTVEMMNLNNHKIMKIFQQIDKEFSRRTVGVITKADMVIQSGGNYSANNSASNEILNLIKKLLSKETSAELPFSFILVKNRSDTNTKIEDNQYKERLFQHTYEVSNIYSVYSRQFG